MKKKLFEFAGRLERSPFVRTIRGGLVNIIPVLMIGAFALIARSLPIKAYQGFITAFLNGFIYDAFNMVYFATFGVLSVYMTASIAISVIREYNKKQDLALSAPATALMVFFLLSGVFESDFRIDALGAKGMMTAIIAGYFATRLYYHVKERLKWKRKSYADGADNLFNDAVTTIIPAAIVITIFAMANAALAVLSSDTTFYGYLTGRLNELFVQAGRGFGGGLLFVVLSSLMWFFGIHGSDCLQGVMEKLYVQGVQANIDSVYAGGFATEVLTKQFFDMFVLIGGCGTALCLLISLLIFSKRRSSRHLSKISIVPMLFNVNETMIFGLPVILNPIMFVPFVLTPVMCYLISYFAMLWHIVPMTVSTVEWTTPLLLGGYAATGSVWGSVLQLVNVTVGVLIYAPFVRLLDRQKEYAAKKYYQEMILLYKQNESDGETASLTELGGERGVIAKQLALDLHVLIERGDFKLYYQPQYSADGKCIGVEALLRWEHPDFDMIYPPLVIDIAKETGMLFKLEKAIIVRALLDSSNVRDVFGENCRISVNMTGDSLLEEGLVPFLAQAMKTADGTKLCIEITEKTALRFDDALKGVLSDIKGLGILLAIDDFSMGQTSLSYLKDSCFDLVKLDGGLVRNMADNPRCLDIIKSIAALSDALDFVVLAEYVETEEQRDALCSVGRREYQGYLYSPAVSIEKLKSEKKRRE